MNSTSTVSNREKTTPAGRRKAKSLQYFRWPLTLFRESEALRSEYLPLDAKTKKTKYPIRVLRYWWILSVLEEEINRRDAKPVIADIGCDKAILKQLFGNSEDVKFIAMDKAHMLERNKPDLDRAAYDELVAGDLDEPIPLDDESVDIAINSHVMEHLPRPEFTLSEIARILRPGGILLMGFPVLPNFLVKTREKQFAKQIDQGQRQTWQHQNAFSVPKARKLMHEAGLEVEFMLGSHCIRKRGAFWENSALLMRLNQLWGMLFPGLGRELCIKAHKPV